MKNIRKWITTGVLIMIALELLVIISLLIGHTDARGNIAIVNVNGPIMSSKEIVDGLKKFRDNEKVKAIVLRVESPGGAVGSSQEIHDEILKTKKVKPVIASFGNTAASGGYYIGVACDKIVADPGTVTGSIGVISQFFMVDEVLKKFDLKWEVIKSGKNKSIGSPLEDMSPEQRDLMQGLIDDMYDQFVTAVANGRMLDKEVVKKVADGRVFSGRQALKLKLVDELGGLEHAIDLAASKVGLDPKNIQSFEYPREKVSLMESVTGQKSLIPEGYSVQYLLR